MKVFITGATGILGKRVTQSLAKLNYEVIGLARSQKNVEQLTHMGAEPRAGDLFKPQQLQEITADCNAILHLATKIPANATPKEKDWEMNNRIRTEGTQNLIKAAETNGIDTFIQQSIIFMYGHQHGANIYSHTPLPENCTAAMLPNVQMEELLTQHPTLSYIILRFGFFYSADSIQTQGMLDGCRNGKFPIIGKGDNYWNMIHADDAASAVVHALQNAPKLARTTFNITDFSPVRYSDLIKAMAKATGGKTPKQIPTWLARLFIRKSMLDFLMNDYKIQPAPDFGDWKPSYASFEEGLKAVLAKRGTI
ncbi:MAG: NAD(P)-dependent oxidoreductase [Saprospiraceae bacterium]